MKENDRKINLTIYPHYTIIFSAKLASMLGISITNVVTGSLSYYPGLTLTLKKFTAGTYESEAAINLAPFNNLNVMLDQINIETNKYNGTPSSVLDVIGV